MQTYDDYDDDSRAMVPSRIIECDCACIDIVGLSVFHERFFSNVCPSAVDMYRQHFGLRTALLNAPNRFRRREICPLVP
jgi:hypothetical protein